MIQPSFATMLCFVQTDAALEAETADLLLGVCVKRSFDRISVDGQLSTNDTAILMASGASGVIVAPESEDELRLGEALDYALRRLALQIVRDGEGARRIGRVHVHGGDERDGRARRARGRELAARQGGAARRRPELGPHRPGRRRRAARRRAAAARHLDRGRAGLRRRRRGPARRRGAGRRGRGDEVEYVVGLPGEGAETEVFFSDLSHEYVTHQRGVHDVNARRRDAARGAPVHPGVPRPDGRHQVRRRGDGATRSCARTSRATSCCSSTSG